MMQKEKMGGGGGGEGEGDGGEWRGRREIVKLDEKMDVSALKQLLILTNNKTKHTFHKNAQVHVSLWCVQVSPGLQAKQTAC